jgi:hypothetical protein
VPAKGGKIDEEINGSGIERGDMLVRGNPIPGGEV